MLNFITVCPLLEKEPRLKGCSNCKMDEPRTALVATGAFPEVGFGLLFPKADDEDEVEGDAIGLRVSSGVIATDLIEGA